jgi:hypothetical protein
MRAAPYHGRATCGSRTSPSRRRGRRQGARALRRHLRDRPPRGLRRPVFVPVERPHPRPVCRRRSPSGTSSAVSRRGRRGGHDARARRSRGGRAAAAVRALRVLHVGRVDLCPTRAAHGLARAGGGFAEFTSSGERMAHGPAPGLSQIQATLVEPTSVGVHAVELTHARPGSWVAVDGVGPMRAWRPPRTAGARCGDHRLRPSARRSAVEALGFRHVLDPRPGDAADAIREITMAWRGALRRRRGRAGGAREDRLHGRIVVVAVPLEPSRCRSPPFAARGDAHDERRPARRGLPGHDRGHRARRLPARGLGRDDPLRRPAERGLRAPSTARRS